MKPGQVVVTQHMLSRRWDQQATILESCSNGHTYIVKINGRSFPSRPTATTEISQEVATPRQYSGLLRTSIGVPAESQIQELFCASVKFDHKISISAQNMKNMKNL